MTAASVETCRFVVQRASPGSPRVGIRRGRAPTPHARALPSVETYEAILSATHLSPAQVPKVFDPELSGELQVRAHAA